MGSGSDRDGRLHLARHFVLRNIRQLAKQLALRFHGRNRVYLYERDIGHILLIPLGLRGRLLQHASLHDVVRSLLQRQLFRLRHLQICASESSGTRINNTVVIILFQSIAAAASFFYAKYLGLYVQLGILLVVGIVGTVTFVLVEWAVKKESKMTSDHDDVSEASSKPWVEFYNVSKLICANTNLSQDKWTCWTGQYQCYCLGNNIVVVIYWSVMKYLIIVLRITCKFCKASTCIRYLTIRLISIWKIVDLYVFII